MICLDRYRWVFFQGRIHAIGMCSTFNISTVNLWNRTKSKTVALAAELEGMKSSFRNKNLELLVHDTVGDCVGQSDIIVTATNSRSPLLSSNMLKADVHINGNSISIHLQTSLLRTILTFTAVGAGVNHHSEIDGDVYEKSKIYVDSWAGAESELKNLNYPIEGEVGEVINGILRTPTQPLTIFHSMGMAVEDAATAQLIMELYKRDNMAE